ncbi:hypothetical protein DLM76_14310 [Leptospira yasudae]|uniref:FG-GAP-like repeat-containing protein n=1 Tax=Leptospira yasudae TaxID=2202201 RepID=UPI000E59BF2C|nr:FG-GAP-like repeat-containing protein [Leptospira yasudae]RHX93260.1 hypothetical protein DLM76_14310 [Leptospira yasudae]
MKRIFEILVSAVLASALLNCAAEGVYNPEISFSTAWWETQILKCVLSGACTDQTPPTLVVGNLSSSHNSILESGFIVGTASDDLLLSRIEVSVDSGPFLPAVGTNTWQYQIPSQWRSGSSHSVQVRSFDFAGNVSPTLNFSFKKGNNKDVNGDGFPDLAATASLFSTTKNGEIYLFYGLGSGTAALNSTSMANVTITGDTTSSFGYALQLGDLNGDGYADLAAGGSFEYGSGTGQLYVFYSTGKNGIVASSFASANLTINAGPSTLLGYSLSLGDVNGDGFTDIAASGYLGAGRALIYYGGAAGVSSIPATTITGPGSNFGSAVRLGDLNGDGFADMIVNGNTYSASAGRLWIFHSTGSAGITAVDTSAPTLTLTGISASDSFGISMTTGDINADGYEDLIAASPGHSGNLGRVYVFHGGTTGISAASPATANQTLTGAIAGERFGTDVVLGDVNGDGFLDLATGAILFNTSMGRLHLFHFSGGTISATASTLITGEAINDQFGTSTFLDCNGDGFSDLVVGAQGNTNAAGRAYLFRSPGSGGLTVSLATSANIAISGYNLPGPTGSIFGSTFGQ